MRIIYLKIPIFLGFIVVWHGFCIDYIRKRFIRT